MANYQTRVADIIGALKQRLTEYEYSGGETVVRELVQNADDAKATSLTFVLLDSGLADAENKLLHGPALVVVNDGPFEPRHRDALTSQSSSSKANEEAAVGRFGIGQKSVFHLCEAFCFVGSSEAGGRIGDALDPWYDNAIAKDEAHPSWGALGDEDQSRIVEAMGALVPASKKNWFVLWIPLRLPVHKRARGGVLTGHWAEDLKRGLRVALTSEELVLLRPQLRNVRRVSAIEMDAVPFDVARARTLLDVHAPDALRLRPDEPGALRATSAEIEAGARRYSVVLHEAAESNDALAAMLEDPRWPQVVYYDDELLTESSRPEKALPHGSISVVRTRVEDGAIPELCVRWAVFLPILEKAASRVLSHGPWTWWITLHGYWFLDHGRRRIRGVWPLPARDPGTPADQIRREWNEAVRDSVTLPALLPAIAGAVADLPATEVTPMVAALERALAEQPRGAWATSRMLVLPAFQDRWVLADDSDVIRVLTIPRPPTATGLAVKPAFDGLGPQRSVVFDDALPLREHGPASWEESDVEAVLTACDSLSLDVDIVGYLTSWLSQVDASQRVGPLARFLWRAAAREQVPGQSSRAAPVWAELVALTDSTRVLAVSGLGVSALAQIARGVPAADGVILPAHLTSGVRGGVPRAASFVTLIAWLSSQSPELSVDVLRQLVATLGPRQVMDIADLAELPCIVVRHGRNWEYVRRSPTELRELVARGLLWLPKGAPRAEDVIKATVQAVSDPTFELHVAPSSKEPSELAAWEYVAGSRDASLHNICSSLVGTDPVALSATALDRVPLLEALLRLVGDRDLEREQPVVRDALRYILHGDPGNIDSALRLWVAERGLDNETLRALLQRAGLGWRVIPSVLTDKLTRSRYEVLRLQEVGASAVRESIGELADDVLVEILRDAPRADRNALLVLLAHDQKFAKRLPVHDAEHGGDPVAADGDHVFRRGAFHVTASVARVITLVRLDDDPAVARIQRELIREWTRDTHLEIATGHIDDDAFDACDEVLSALEAGASPTPELRASRWVPLVDGARTSPDRVVLENDALAEAAPLLERAKLFSERTVARSVRDHAAWQTHRDHLALRSEDAWRVLCDTLIASGDELSGYAIAPDAKAAQKLIDCLRTNGAARTLLGELAQWRFALAAAEAAGDLSYRALAGHTSPAQWRESLSLLASSPLINA